MIDLSQMPTDGLYFYTPSEAYPLPSVQRSDDRIVITLYPYTVVCKPATNLISVSVDHIVVSKLEESGAASVLDDIITNIEKMADTYRYQPLNQEVCHSIADTVYKMHVNLMNSCRDYDNIVRQTWSAQNAVQ